MEYTVRGFRGKIKAALDGVDSGERVFVYRSGKAYEVIACTREKEPVYTGEAEDLVQKAASVFKKKDVDGGREYRMAHHGCGCEKEGGVMMCKKHGRL